ncbi:MAG: nuclear transport factor 2 family protein [Microbacteriaceae bacterium]|jgi:hypothetical protein
MSATPPPHPIVAAYLNAVEAGDADAMLALFADGAVVHSPLYGTLPATEFYPLLFADTGSSVLTLLGTMQGTSVDGAALLSFLFHFDWTLADGTLAPFDVVDVAELDDAGLISSLRIVYDTVRVRPAFEASTGTSSVR